jgi:hypothetical protein
VLARTTRLAGALGVAAILAAATAVSALASTGTITSYPIPIETTP